METYTYTAPSGVTVVSCRPPMTYGFRDNCKFVFRWTSVYILYRNIIKKNYGKGKIK